MGYIILFLIAFADLLFGEELAIAYKRETSTPITGYYVYGERCSGTNYTHQLMGQNCGLNQIMWCHKHFPPWYDLGPEHWLGNPNIYHHNTCSHLLFIIVVRDPYDWICSLNLQPHSAHLSLRKLPLSEFIRTTWVLDDEDRVVKAIRKFMPLMDMDPTTGKPFDNVMKLRSAKIKAYKQVMERAPNVIFVRYETVRDHPEKFLKRIQDLYGVNFNPEYTPIDRYKGCTYWPVYKPRKYENFSKQDLQFINNQLDKALENSLGYELKQK